MAFPAFGTSVPSLSNFQAQLNGLTLGSGTAYAIDQITGLDNPPVDSGDVQRTRDQGELVGLDFYKGRDITVSGDVVSDGTSLQHALTALGAATYVGGATETPLWLQFPNLPLLCSMVRTRKRTATIDVSWASGLSKPVAVMFHSSDPRLYAAPVQATVGLPAPAGGLTFNATPPFVFGGGGTFGSISANNTGNVEMRPTFTITGPCTNPVVQNVTTGWYLAFSNPAQTGFTLNSGDTLTVDTDLRTVIYTAFGSTSGQSRRNWILPGAIWPDPIKGIGGLAPGVNTVEFSSGDSSSVAGTLTLDYAPAYII